MFSRISVRRVVLALALPLAIGSTFANSQPPASLLGRWELTVHGKSGDYPSWLEIKQSGRTALVGSYVGQFGSARPISKIDVSDDKFHFSVPPQWEHRSDDVPVEGKIGAGDTLSGETTDDQGNRITWEARRAPLLKRESPPQWGQPINLFNGKDLAGWKTRSAGSENGWVVRDGVLTNAKPGNDLVSEQQFTDFKIVAEFRYEKGSNSGIYLRGRYEVQIEDNFGDEPESHKIGGVYGFLTPRINAAKKAGEWQTLEVTLVGREVTIVLNGETVISRQEIPGITGGALDSYEAKPGPIMLQGDHGPVEFRKVTITPGM